MYVPFLHTPWKNESKRPADVHTPLPKRGIYPFKVGWKPGKARGTNKRYVISPLDTNNPKTDQALPGCCDPMPVEVRQWYWAPRHCQWFGRAAVLGNGIPPNGDLTNLDKYDKGANPWLNPFCSMVFGQTSLGFLSQHMS